MQIVIEIPEEKYDRLMKQMQLDRNFSECKITPLPKGHGRLIDADAIIDAGFSKRFCDWYHEIKYAQTIIEADKEVMQE